MGSCYSIDLRQKALAAYRAGLGSQKQICEMLHLGTATMGRWVRLDRERGGVEPLPHGGGQPRKIGAIGEIILLSIIEDNPDATLDELTEFYCQATKNSLHVSSIRRALKRLKITRKKRPSIQTREKHPVFRSFAKNSLKR